MLLLALLQLLMITNQQLYTGVNSTAYMYNNTAMVKTNSLNGTTGLMPTIPYHQLQIFSNNTIEYAYGFNNVSASNQATHFIQYLGIDRRADYRAPILLRLALGHSNSTSANSNTLVRLITLTAASNFTVVGSVSFHFAGVGYTVSSPSNITVDTGGFTFRYISANSYYHTSYSTSINGTFDLDTLLEFAITKGAVAPLDLLSYLSISSNIVCGVGTITTDHELRFLVKPAFKNGKIIACAGWNFQLEILATNQTLSDYYNVSTPEIPTMLSDLSFSFLQTAVKYNAKCTIKLGNHNKTWVTTKGNYSLPIAVNANIKLLSTMAITQTINASSQTAACLTINLRNDWSTGSQTFTAAKLTPDREIHVCPWWSISPQGTLVAGPIQYGTVVYNLYTVTTTVGAASWPVHIFAAVNQTLQVSNLDLMGFVRYISTNLPIVTAAETIAGVEAGFRVVSGQGAWTMQSFSLAAAIGLSNQTVTVYVPPPPSIDPTNSSDPIISCIFSSFDTTAKECEFAPSLMLVVSTIMASPNLGLVLKVTSFFWAVDDLAYFSYHQRSYDPSFEFAAQVSWQLTNQKWMLPVLEPIYTNVKADFESAVPQSKIGANTPNSYALNNEDSYFLRGTSQIWLSSVPLSIFAFIFFAGLRKIVFKCSFLRLANLLAKFQFPCFLLVNLVGDNVQYLSFRCFSQVYQLIPTNNSIVSYVNLTVSYTVLFIVLTWSASGYLLLSSVLKRHRHLLYEGFIPSWFMTAHYSIVLTLRVINGALHSLLYDQPTLQISLLGTIQSLIVTLTIINRKSYQRKSIFFTDLIEGILRLSLHSFLLLEVLLAATVEQKAIVLEEFGEITSLMVQLLIVWSVLNVLLNAVIPGVQTQKQKRKNPKLQIIMEQLKQLKKIRYDRSRKKSSFGNMLIMVQQIGNSSGESKLVKHFSRSLASIP